MWRTLVNKENLPVDSIIYSCNMSSHDTPPPKIIIPQDDSLVNNALDNFITLTLLLKHPYNVIYNSKSGERLVLTYHKYIIYNGKIKINNEI